MLSDLSFLNFQGFRGLQTARLAPITLIFGPNASGKSSVRRIFQTLQTAFEDTEKNCENSRLPQLFEHLTYGWDSGGPKPDLPLGVSVSMTGRVSGETDPSTFLKPLKVEIGVDFKAENGGVALQQVITFGPDKQPNFYDFQFLKNIDEFNELDIEELREALIKAIELAEGLESDAQQPDLNKSGDPKPVQIEVTQADLKKSHFDHKRKSELLEGVIDFFNKAQDVVVFSDSWMSRDYVWAAKYLLEILNFGIKRAIPEGITHQFFEYKKSSSGSYELQLNEVAGHFIEFLDREPDSENWVYEGADLELAALIAPKIVTTGFLLANPSSWHDPYDAPEEEWEDDLGERIPGKDGAARAISNSIDRNSEQLRNLIVSKLRFIKPWRGIPAVETQGDPASLPSADVQAKINENLAKLTDDRYRYEFQNTVGRGEFRDRSTVRDTYTNVSLPHDEVGTGLSQLLPILLDLAIENDGVTYIEQPELHLHPKAQSDLMDVIVDEYKESVNSGPSDRQFILETHSESMLLRLQKRIRLGDISSEEVSVLFMQPVSHSESDDGQGFNKVIELKIDHLGDVIDPFPVSFVDLRIHDLF